jgi:hypothetical protein
MTERVCQTCGSWLPNPKGRRRFCSERCRKASYGGTCVDCGALTSGNNGREKAPRRCQECDNRFHSERQQAHYRAKNDKLAALYLSGMPLTSIAAEMGWAGAGSVAVQVNRLRSYGYDLPYRYRSYGEKRKAVA